MTFKVHAPSAIVIFRGQSDFTTTRFLGIEIEQNVFGQTIDRLDKNLVEDFDESTIVPDSFQMLLKFEESIANIYQSEHKRTWVWRGPPKVLRHEQWTGGEEIILAVHRWGACSTTECDSFAP